MTPAQTWLLIAVGIPTIMGIALVFTRWLEGRDPIPLVRATTGERCECGQYQFLCDNPDPHPPHRYDAGDGTVHRPDLCQPADEAL